MATSFPSGLDSFVNPSASDALDSGVVPHAAQHANVNDAMEAVQAKLGVGAHTLGEWTSFTPVFTNFTLGNGTVSAKYCQINDLVFVRGSVVWGSTTSVTSTIRIAHPVGTAGNPINTYGGQARYADTGTAEVIGYVKIETSNAVLLSVNSSVTYAVAQGAFSATIPFTWATSDQIEWQYCYEKA